MSQNNQPRTMTLFSYSIKREFYSPSEQSNLEPIFGILSCAVEQTRLYLKFADQQAMEAAQEYADWEQSRRDPLELVAPLRERYVVFNATAKNGLPCGVFANCILVP